MSKYKLWAVYVPFLEQWTRETGARMEAQIDTEHEDFLEVEYFDNEDPRVAMYGWTDFPLFTAVKYGTPYNEIVGKRSPQEYDTWIYNIGWKTKE